MLYLTFSEYVARRDEGVWLPNRPVVASMVKINPLPITQARLDRIVTKAGKPPAPVRPIIPSPLSQLAQSISRVVG